MRTIISLIVLGCIAATASGKDQKVQVSSTPPGAMVFVDNTYEGITPLSKDFAPGTYRLKLMRKGFSDCTLTVKIPLDKPAVEAVLKALKKGSISITSVPPKCIVYLGGREAGETPLVINDLPDDVYEVRIEKQSYETVQTAVEIKDGKDSEVAVELKSRVEELCLEKLQKNPDDLSVYTELGHHYLLEGKWESARETMKKGVLLAARLGPREPEIQRFYEELTKQFTGQFKFTDDLVAFRDSFSDVIEYAIEFGPKRSAHTQRLVSLYAAMGRADSMTKLAERMHATDPQRNVFREFADTYLQTGMTSVAIKMLERAIEVNDDFDTRLALRSAYQRVYKMEQALEQYSKAEKMDSTPAKKANLMILLARLYALKKMPDKAIDCIDAAIELDPRGKMNSSYLTLRVNTLIEAGRCDDARDAVNEFAKNATDGATKKLAESQLILIDKHCKPPEPVQE